MPVKYKNSDALTGSGSRSRRLRVGTPTGASALKRREKLKIAVLMGGPSSEHEVSLASGKMVVNNLSRRRHDVVSIILPQKPNFSLENYLSKDLDVAFLALHGEWGEDGQVQKILENLDVVYTGSDSKTSSLAMNKFATLSRLRRNGILTPSNIIVKDSDSMPQSVSIPCVIKPNKRGSSVGVSIVRSRGQLKQALKKALEFDNEALVEKFIEGRELTCGVLDDGRGKIVPLIPTEIVPRMANFFDYKSKYERGGADEITPPHLGKDRIKRVQDLAVRVHKIMGASGISRTDMILTKDGKLYVLEINTIPGMTPTSLLPKGAAACGLSFPQLLDKIVKAARNRVKK